MARSVIFKRRVGALMIAPLLLCSSCSLIGHRLELRQGNALSATQIDQLAEGMTREQVLFLLGSPTQEPVFDQSRWDYVYSEGQAGHKVSPYRRLSVFFEGDQVTRIDSDYPTIESETAAR